MKDRCTRAHALCENYCELIRRFYDLSRIAAITSWTITFTYI